MAAENLEALTQPVKSKHCAASLRQTFSRHNTAGALVLLLLGALALPLGCGEAANDGTCRAGTPQPIFETSDSSVVAHDFQLSGQTSLETTAFSNGLFLALEQRGCDTLNQAFTFAHPGLSTELDTFLQQGALAFYALAGVSERVVGFSEYGRIIGGLNGKILEGAPVTLAPGFSVRIIRLPTPERVTWQVVFEQDFGAVGTPQ